VNDILFEEENKIEKIYAIYRGRKNANIVRYVNYFGRKGGFDAIARRLQRNNAESGWCPLEIVSNFVETISNLSSYLYLEFTREYIPIIWEAVSSSIMKPTE
jgi:hypothetical protein